MQELGVIGPPLGGFERHELLRVPQKDIKNRTKFGRRNSSYTIGQHSSTTTLGS